MNSGHSRQESREGQHQQNGNDDPDKGQQHYAAARLHDLRNKGRHDDFDFLLEVLMMPDMKNEQDKAASVGIGSKSR